MLHDPKAVELVDTIDYPFEERFGVGHPRQAQGQALRVLCFDQEIRRFLSVHPKGTVTALGEGLETQFWRVDNGRVRWLTVDLPVRELRLSRGREMFWGYLAPLMNVVPVVHNKRLTVLVGGKLQTVALVRFGSSRS
jgi:hypothetical protein